LYLYLYIGDNVSLKFGGRETFCCPVVHIVNAGSCYF